MGMNYYQPLNVCSVCGRGDARRHIGKSSAGWCFALHVIPEDGIHDLDDWLKLFGDAPIVDEGGKPVTSVEMMRVITERTWLASVSATPRKWVGYRDEADFHASNNSEPGPNGLVRHRLDGRHCIKHGAGTWDCIVGEFS